MLHAWSSFTHFLIVACRYFLPSHMLRIFHSHHRCRVILNCSWCVRRIFLPLQHRKSILAYMSCILVSSSMSVAPHVKSMCFNSLPAKFVRTALTVRASLLFEWILNGFWLHLGIPDPPKTLVWRYRYLSLFFSVANEKRNATWMRNCYWQCDAWSVGWRLATTLAHRMSPSPVRIPCMKFTSSWSSGINWRIDSTKPWSCWSFANTSAFQHVHLTSKIDADLGVDLTFLKYFLVFANTITTITTTLNYRDIIVEGARCFRLQHLTTIIYR